MPAPISDEFLPVAYAVAGILLGLLSTRIKPTSRPRQAISLPDSQGGRAVRPLLLVQRVLDTLGDATRTSSMDYARAVRRDKRTAQNSMCRSSQRLLEYVDSLTDLDVVLCAALRRVVVDATAKARLSIEYALSQGCTDEVCAELGATKFREVILAGLLAALPVD